MRSRCASRAWSAPPSGSPRPSSGSSSSCGRRCKPEAPPAARSATLSNVTLDRSVAFGQYLDRIKLTRAPYTPATLSRRGAYVEFDYAIAGYKGKRLPLRWQLVDAEDR